MALSIHVDGGARGNPGPAGAGVVIRTEDGRPVFEAAYFLGTQTNNAAEYHALIRALQRAGRCEPQPVIIHSDSELLVRQITGEYRVKNPKLAQLFEQVQLHLLQLGRWSIRHVRREQNRRADELANLAMDRRANIIVFDADGGAAGNGGAASALGEAPPDEAPAPEAGLAPAAADAAPASAGPTESAHGLPIVRVTVSRRPEPGTCPAGAAGPDSFVLRDTLPAGLCVHAAHALLPTVLAILNVDPQEVAAVPTLTVRCGRPDCRAEFQVSAEPSRNGRSSGRGRGRRAAHGGGESVGHE